MSKAAGGSGRTGQGAAGRGDSDYFDLDANAGPYDAFLPPTDPKQAARIASVQSMADQQAKLDPGERGTLLDYTAASYVGINDYLRGYNTNSDYKYPAMVMQDIVGRSVLPRSTMLYRSQGKNTDRVSALEVGDTWQFKGMTSTSMSSTFAKSWSGLVLFRIKAKKGSKARIIGKDNHEALRVQFEVLLPHNGKAKVVAIRDFVRPDGRKAKMIDLEYR